MYAAQQNTSLFLGGERTSGQSIRDQNGKSDINESVPADLLSQPPVARDGLTEVDDRQPLAIADRLLNLTGLGSAHNFGLVTTLGLALYPTYSNQHVTGTFCVLVLAAASIANIVKSSLGPVGLDKMIVNQIGVGLSMRLPPDVDAG